METPDRKKVARLLRYQALMLLLVTSGAWVFGMQAAWSALLGGSVALMANVIFALLMFAPYRAAEPGKLMARLYMAEALKLVLVGLAFAVLFLWVKPLSVAALFVAFFMVQVVSPLLAHTLAGNE